MLDTCAVSDENTLMAVYPHSGTVVAHQVIDWEGRVRLSFSVVVTLNSCQEVTQTGINCSLGTARIIKTRGKDVVFLFVDSEGSQTIQIHRLGATKGDLTLAHSTARSAIVPEPF